MLGTNQTGVFAGTGIIQKAPRSNGPTLRRHSYRDLQAVTALNEVVAPLVVNVSDTVEMWVVTVVDLVDDPAIGLRFVGANAHVQ